MTEEKIKEEFDKAFKKNFPEAVIIHGVNVAGCKYYHYKGCTANNFGKCDSCSEIYKNCYYKQLQRTKEHNRELQAYYDAQEKADWKGAWEKLKQENEKIRTRQIKLYIALDVIKDIAEKYSDSIDKANDALYSIIDKINEVIK